MTESVFLPQEVYARWAYSEIVEGALSYIYDGFDAIDEMRAKRKANVSFEKLSNDDLRRLALLCSIARPDLIRYCSGVQAFSLVALSKVVACGKSAIAMVEPSTNPVPMTASWNAAPPAETDGGSSWMLVVVPVAPVVDPSGSCRF